MDIRIARRGWQVGVIAVVAVALLMTWPLSPNASAGVRTPSATPVGNTYGTVTPQGQPLIVDMTSTRRRIPRTVVTLEVTCTSGATFTFVDKYTDLPVTRAGRFRASIGPVTERNADGTTTDYQGRIAGDLNDTKTRIAGVWRIVWTNHDAAGTVTDTCD
ncbi:MAG TPA: hypothetical protein VFR56_12300, partial [Actinomycetes bacterium]|nr:hypothetical protein [Actinomycetes bacterium]